MTLNIDESKFTISTNKRFLYDLIEASIEKSGNSTNKLADNLINHYKIERYIKRTLIDSIRKWQRAKRRLPLDIFLSLCKFSELSPNIKNISMYGARTGLNRIYPIRLDKFWAFISECIRVEGTLDKKRFVLENTNTEITDKLKKALVNIGIKKENIKESLDIKVQVPENIAMNGIKIMNLTNNKEVKKFYNRELNLKLGKKKEIVFMEKDFSYNKDLSYRVYYNNRFFDAKLKVLYKGKIYAESNFDDERYQKISVALKLMVWNKTLSYILNKCLKIPYGNKSSIIRIPKIIKNSSKNILKSVINATFAAESTFSVKNRFISICSISSEYLKDFQKLLLKFNIISRINKNKLLISNIRNFRKIKNNFDFIIKEKNKKMAKLLEIKIEEFPKGMSKVFYLNALERLKKATSIQIRNYHNRSGNSFRLYINQLLHERYIRETTSLRPRIYEITKKGRIFLKEKKIYLL